MRTRTLRVLPRDSLSSPPPFNALAITPDRIPTVDAVSSWNHEERPQTRLGVLLRRAQTPGAALLRDDALMAFAQRCNAAGHCVVLSCTATDIESKEVSARSLSRVGLRGIQIKGDPPDAIFHAVSRALGEDFVVGRSCHGPAPAAADAPWSYTTVAPVFRIPQEKPEKPSEGIGVDTLRRWCEAVPQVFALGGIVAANIAPCLEAGAFGVAGIRLFFGDAAHVMDNMNALGRAIERHTALPLL